jgi:hypothetical protein
MSSLLDNWLKLLGYSLELQNKNVKFKTETEIDRTPVPDTKAQKFYSHTHQVTIKTGMSLDNAEG